MKKIKKIKKKKKEGKKLRRQPQQHCGNTGSTSCLQRRLINHSALLQKAPALYQPITEPLPQGRPLPLRGFIDFFFQFCFFPGIIGSLRCEAEREKRRRRSVIIKITS
ncbi:hypothetical protein XENTR_v10020392 [Xenopus tropicalis]|nr:hypothetical protein XENTR_v10020392 [Xenopus tropicalis]